MVSLALGDVGSLAADTLPSDVLDMAQQTLAILSQVLPAKETAELQLHLPIARLNILDGKFGRMIASRLLSLLQMCKSDTSPLTAEVRRSCLRMCLKSLWYCAKAYHQLGASEWLPSYFPHTLASPEVIHLIQAEQDPVSRVIGRCFEALVLKKLLGGVKTSTDSDIQIGDEELACLSAILGTKRDDVRLCLEWPGAVELANMVSLSLGDVGSLVVNALPPNALDVTQQTLAILSQVLLAEETVELQLELPIARLNISEGKFDRVIVSHLHNVLQMCISGTSPLTTEVRRSCLRMCLKSLWYCAKAYNQFSASEWLPSYFTLAIASPEIIRLIQAEKDPVAHMIGRCFGALIVNNLVTYVKSHTDSNAQSGDEVLGYLSAILGTESRDLRLSLGRAGTVELANMLSLIFSEIDSLLPDTAPSDVLDMIQQTYSILSRTLLTELNDKLMIFPDGPLPLTEPLYESRSCMCLKNLWHCATAYNQLGISVPLPSFVRISLASPEITRRIHTDKDLTARVTGRCACALIVNKLVDDFQSRISFGDGVYDAELACISSILGIEPDEFLRWPHHSTAIKLLNVISLMSGEIEALFIWEETPADVLRVMQQTLNIICSGLVLGGVFASGDLRMDQVSLLREICSRITNAQPADRFRDQTVELLDQLQQISKQLPLVGYKMRRCASSIFDPQLVRERGNLTPRPEYEVRRRRSKSM
ncbi:hypothetical protein EDB89DRAFT_60432 [Lactarius sanguifluus]|nr:hypothetical protein EDB89DRAFT_60432 [Lactarius sanguifluus]